MLVVGSPQREGSVERHVDVVFTFMFENVLCCMHLALSAYYPPPPIVPTSPSSPLSLYLAYEREVVLYVYMYSLVYDVVRPKTTTVCFISVCYSVYHSPDGSPGPL